MSDEYTQDNNEYSLENGNDTKNNKHGWKRIVIIIAILAAFGAIALAIKEHHDRQKISGIQCVYGPPVVSDTESSSVITAEDSAKDIS